MGISFGTTFGAGIRWCCDGAFDWSGDRLNRRAGTQSPLKG